MRVVVGWSSLLPCVALLTLAGCMENGGTCTLSVEPAVEVEVRDGATQEFLATTPRGIAQEGTYQDSLQVWTMTADVPPRVATLAGASERAGTYSVHLEADGYQPWDTAGVRVTEGDCHVRTVRFTAEMTSTAP
jgi:hypothetical protein